MSRRDDYRESKHERGATSHRRDEGGKKRRRSSSHEGDRKQKVEKTTEDKVSFSFLDHKRFFHRLLMGYNVTEQLVDDASDFWLFLSKYEALLRRNGQSVLSIQTEAPQTNSVIPKEYHKAHLMSLKLKPSKSQAGTFNDEDKSIDDRKIKIFLTIVTHYLDFKQKERFQKLKKLRKFQASLPIAAFEKEIVEAVKNESILILAGDTGCGKSTQVKDEGNYENIAR